MYSILRFALISHLSSLMFLSVYPGWGIWDMGYIWLTACVWGRGGGYFLFVGVFFFWWKGRQKWHIRCLIFIANWFPCLCDCNSGGGGGVDCTRCTCFWPNFVFSFSVLVAKYLHEFRVSWSRRAPRLVRHCLSLDLSDSLSQTLMDLNRVLYSYRISYM